MNKTELVDHIAAQSDISKAAAFLSLEELIKSHIESLDKQITQTQTFKKGLLQQMFV